VYQSADGDGGDDRHESTVPDAASSAIPMFQNQLMQFLDTKAPVIGISHYLTINCFMLVWLHVEICLVYDSDSLMSLR